MNDTNKQSIIDQLQQLNEKSVTLTTQLISIQEQCNGTNPQSEGPAQTSKPANGIDELSTLISWIDNNMQNAFSAANEIDKAMKVLGFDRFDTSTEPN